jgi:hypothetical protein
MKSNSRYLKLSEEQKQDIITKKKNEFKQDIFDKYNFKYKPEKKSKLPSF